MSIMLTIDDYIKQDLMTLNRENVMERWQKVSEYQKLLAKVIMNLDRRGCLENVVTSMCYKELPHPHTNPKEPLS